VKSERRDSLSRGPLILGGVGTALHFGGRKILGPGEQDPDMAEGIADARRTRAVEHLGQGLLGRAAGGEGARQQGRVVVAEDSTPALVAPRARGSP
jgi:hypothetical protein